VGAREFIGQPLPAPDGLAGTEIIVAWDGRARGRITLEDQIRPDAAEAIRQLGRQTVSVSLLSGDNRETAESVARAAGISQIEAPRRPDEKIEAIRAAARSGKVVCMVGDGINDAPALAAADIGIAMGAATDLSRLAGNVALLSDRLVMVPWLIDLSRYTRRIIAQNLAWAFGYNAVALAAAAVGWLHPLLAAAAMVFSSVTVLANSARIRAFPEVAGGKSSS
jgi:P-type E1-E2 ATPase